MAIRIRRVKDSRLKRDFPELIEHAEVRIDGINGERLGSLFVVHYKSYYKGQITFNNNLTLSTKSAFTYSGYSVPQKLTQLIKQILTEALKRNLIDEHGEISDAPKLFRLMQIHDFAEDELPGTPCEGKG